ncbi:enoyl-CoA hydratase-related protein [Nocardia africana]|uniref:1,4-Dihydroxy-2-naphthoyl-CoA synthase n=1 Tax=Nocardia africana TaxID=134964 RepID=A0A378WW79_9NOCA|nr:enoyl-CoA hydratase-related protein [Nocardia africana]MCC3313605.1 enoyl-CoA hydratase/isomerase family protein [Nocardia africana]SUA45017.1 1,4-Dihydroxy-2-naphthoyl-CoA synthase [Nocardia africana]
MSYEEILYSVRDHIATISMNRPAARNGYTLTIAAELGDAFTVADHDPDVRAIILTGEGADFCVGMDLSSGAPGDEVSEDWLEPAGQCSRRIFECTKPVIAAIRGAAVGAGSTIILPSDYRIAATDSRFGYVFTRRGFFPEGASAWHLPRIVGMGRAMDWMLTGRVFPAAEALAGGLVHQVVEPDQVLPAAETYAKDLIEHTAPVSVAVTRQMLLRLSAFDSPYPAHAMDSKLIAGLGGSADAVEGITSFLQRRSPDFPGRVPADIPAVVPWKGIDQADTASTSR